MLQHHCTSIRILTTCYQMAEMNKQDTCKTNRTFTSKGICRDYGAEEHYIRPNSNRSISKSQH